MIAVAQLGRFTLREVSVWDAPELFALYGDPQTVRYMGLRQLRDVEQAWGLVERLQKSPTRWLSVLNEHGEFLGIVGLEVQGHQATMSLAFKRTSAARGAGRELASPLVRWIFTHPQIWRVWSYVHVDNIAGQRVTERTGATCEGVLRRFEFFPNISDEPQSVRVYAIVR